MRDEQFVLRPRRLASESIDVPRSGGLIEAGEELLGAQRQSPTRDDLEGVERTPADELGQFVRRTLDRRGREKREAARLIAIRHELGDERTHRVPDEHGLLRQLGDRLHDVVHVVAQERAAEALAATGVAVPAQGDGIDRETALGSRGHPLLAPAPGTVRDAVDEKDRRLAGRTRLVDPALGHDREDLAVCAGRRHRPVPHAHDLGRAAHLHLYGRAHRAAASGVMLSRRCRSRSIARRYSWWAIS